MTTAICLFVPCLLIAAYVYTQRKKIRIPFTGKRPVSDPREPRDGDANAN